MLQIRRLRRPARPALLVLAVLLGAGAVPPSASGQPDALALPPEVLALDDVSPAFLGMYRKVMQIEPEIRRHAERYGLDPDLARAVCLYESGGNPGLTSVAGAQGFFQVMPATYRSLRVQSNIEAGVKYLAQMVERFDRQDYAVAAYNTGPGRVARGRAMPLETLQYVLGVGHYRTVLKLYDPLLRRYAEQVALTEVADGETWWQVARRLDVPLTQLRLHNPFLASRVLKPGAVVAYPIGPRANPFDQVDDHLTYRTRLGDNYLTLAFTLDVTPSDLRAANDLWHLQTVPAGMPLRIPLAEAASDAEMREVLPGEDLDAIVRGTGVDPWRLIRDNRLLLDERVEPGMVLRISTARPPQVPATTVHRVQRGDTLIGLARRYNTTVRALQDLNGMGRRTGLRAGARLIVPSPESSASRSTAGRH